MSATPTEKLPLDRAIALASTLLGPAQLAFYALHPRLRLPLRERLGALPRDARSAAASSRRCVLFHAASAGDVRAAVPVIRALTAGGDLRAHLTLQTRSGRDTAHRLLADTPCGVSALPIEALGAHERLLAALRPAACVLEYLELWPGLLRAARGLGCPVLLMNARLHPKRRARYTHPAFRERLRALHVLSARSDDDARALAHLGLPGVPARLHTKHALLDPPTPEAVARLRARHGLAPRAQTWIAGSVHADELDAVLDAQRALRLEGLSLILAPRYPRRLGSSFAARARALGLSVRRSRGEGEARPADVVVVETMGELASLYGAARVALVGGTLGRRGGQNPLEPAIAGCSVLCGPHTTQIEGELERIDCVRVDATSLANAVRTAFRAPPSTLSSTAVIEEARVSVLTTAAEIRAVARGEA